MNLAEPKTVSAYQLRIMQAICPPSIPNTAGIQPTVSEAIEFTAEPNMIPPKPATRYSSNIGMNLILVC